MTPDGKRAWKLYHLPAGFDHAITHAAFSPDGNKFVWTERIKASQLFNLNLFAGAYELNVGYFVATPQPHLTNVRHIIPGAVDKGGEVERWPATTRPSRSTAPASSRPRTNRQLPVLIYPCLPNPARFSAGFDA